LDELLTLLKQGRTRDARLWVKRQSTKPQGQNFDLCNAAVDLFEGKLADCERKLSFAINQKPNDWTPNFLYGTLLTKLGRGKDALIYAERAFTESGGRADCLKLLLHTYLDNSKVDEIIALSTKLKPEILETRQVLLALASAYRAKRNSKKALEYVEILEKKNAKDPVARRLRADIVGEYDSPAAVAIYKEVFEMLAAESKPIDDATKWNSSLHFLRTRVFTEGWTFWESGFSKEVGVLGRNMPHVLREAKRVSEGELGTPGWITLVPEQGIGDQVLFLTALAELYAVHKECLIIADDRLVPILRRSFPELPCAHPGLLEFQSKLSISNLGILPYGSLLPIFRPTLNSFLKNRGPFLEPDQSKVKEYREILLARAKGRRIIGISWKGGYWINQKSSKALSLKNWEPLLKKDRMYVCLQYGDVSEEKKWVREMKFGNVVFIDGIDFKKDIDAWFALICAVDEVISVSTAAVHFSGSVGKQTTILVPEKQGPWILGMEDKEHPAYANSKIERVSANRTIEDILNAL
jgi:tetratricopeptide (TPR) repeat protein